MCPRCCSFHSAANTRYPAMKAEACASGLLGCWGEDSSLTWLSAPGSGHQHNLWKISFQWLQGSFFSEAMFTLGLSKVTSSMLFWHEGFNFKKERQQAPLPRGPTLVSSPGWCTESWPGKHIPDQGVAMTWMTTSRNMSRQSTGWGGLGA